MAIANAVHTDAFFGTIIGTRFPDLAELLYIARTGEAPGVSGHAWINGDDFVCGCASKNVASDLESNFLIAIKAIKLVAT